MSNGVRKAVGYSTINDVHIDITAIVHAVYGARVCASTCASRQGCECGSNASLGRCTDLVDGILPRGVTRVALLFLFGPMRIQLVDLAGHVSVLLEVECLPHLHPGATPAEDE